jgi:hypothetical protein
MNITLYIRVLWSLSLKLNVAEKGTLDLVGAEKFCVKLVLLSYKGIGKRREGLVRNRGNCEPVTYVVISIIVEVVVIVLT